MEGNALTTFLTNIGSVITQLLAWLANVATALIGNEIFQIMVAIIVFVLLFGLMVGLAKGIRGRRKKK